jgi:matrixin
MTGTLIVATVIAVPWLGDCAGQPLEQPSLPVTWSMACGTDAPPHVTAGFNYWNDSTGVLVFTQGPCDTGVVVHLSQSVEEDASQLDGGQGSTHAGAQSGQGDVWLSSDLPTIVAERGDAIGRSAVAHEAGHVLGFAHTTEDCLMRAVLTHDADLCEDEIDAFYTVYSPTGQR